MAALTVDCGSFDRYSYNGVTQYGGIVNFSIPAGATITGCSVSFTTHASGGNTADRAFSINGTRAHSGWASAGALNAYLLQPGNNTFRVTLKSTTPGGYTVCWWDISGITLYITYTIGGGSTPPPVGGGGPVVITPSSIDAGAGSVTVTCPAEPGIWHMIDWTFGSYSGSWSHPWEAGGTNTINIPLSWIEEMPSAASGTLAIRVRRSTTPAMPYSYATDQTTNITINVPASVVPSISDFTATLVLNGVPGTISGYVQGKSKVTLAMTAAGGSYSPISTYRIAGGGIDAYAASGTFGPFNASGDMVFTATVVDARGRSASRQVNIDIMPYTSPVFSAPEAWRSNYDGVKNQKGTYARLKSGASFSSLEGQNAATLKGRVYIKGGAAPAWETMTPDTELILGGGTLLFTRTYIAQIQVSDLLESRITEFIIPTKKTGFSIMAGVSGAAIGKSAETPGILDVAWPIVAPGIPPNPNLLHNSDFTNPINQRGIIDGYAPSYGYTYDRWLMSDGIWLTVNLSVDFTAATDVRTPYILQSFEMDMRGRTYTVSLDLYDYGIKTFVIEYPADGSTASVVWDGLLCVIQRPGSVDLLSISNYNTTKGFRIKRVKLELGPVSTLHLDPPMDHAVELEKCRRYLKPLPRGSGRLFNSTSSVVELAWDLNPPMRIAPSLYIPSLTNAILVQGAGLYTPTSFTTWEENNANLFVVKFNGTYGAMHPGTFLNATGCFAVADI